jgi:hypothetical protein
MSGGSLRLATPIPCSGLDSGWDLGPIVRDHCHPLWAGLCRLDLATPLRPVRHLLVNCHPVVPCAGQPVPRETRWRATVRGLEAETGPELLEGCWW